MSKKPFTQEEIAILKENPYTFSVTEKHISYTREFKELFWADYQNRMQPSQIFQKYGYDPKMIGRPRITGFQQSLKKEVDAGLRFRNGKRPSGMRKELSSEEGSYAETIRDLQHRIDYLEQEVDFLKKISSIKTSKK